MLIKISKSPAQKLHILVARGKKKKNIMRVVVRVINSPHTHTRNVVTIFIFKLGFFSVLLKNYNHSYVINEKWKERAIFEVIHYPNFPFNSQEP